MAQLQIAYLPRPGTQERGPRLCQEAAEFRPEQNNESRLPGCRRGRAIVHDHGDDQFLVMMRCFNE
jgi:hypothetical protein